MALAGVGMDIVDVARMERACKRTPAFIRRMFTDEERAYCERTARPPEHYAGRFAAREAVLKALGCGFSQGVGFQDVSVMHDQNGRPKVQLKGKALEIARAQGVQEVAISISFTHDVAVANAVAVTQEVRPRQDQTKDQKDMLTQDFKEARSVIDELERLQAHSLDALDTIEEVTTTRVQ